MRNNAEGGRCNDNTNDQNRPGLKPASIVFFQSHRSVLSLRQEIAKAKSVAQHFFAGAKSNRRFENGAIENEGMEFAILSAGIDAGRQIGEERGVEFAPGERVVQNSRIDANR